jgi:hypothetical protein
MNSLGPWIGNTMLRKLTKLASVVYIYASAAVVAPAQEATAYDFVKCKREVDAFVVQITTSTKPSTPGFAAQDLAQYLDTNAVCGQSPDVVDEVAGLLNSKNDSVRFGAALALANIGPPAGRAVPALRRALAESDAELDEYFRQSRDYMMPTQYSGVAIRAALKRITGENVSDYHRRD